MAASEEVAANPVPSDNTQIVKLNFEDLFINLDRLLQEAIEADAAFESTGEIKGLSEIKELIIRIYKECMNQEIWEFQSFIREKISEQSQKYIDEKRLAWCLTSCL